MTDTAAIVLDSGSYTVGDWLVEPAMNRISRQDEQILLEPKTMAVLDHLAAHAGRVVSGEALISAIWDDRPMGDNPIYKCIGQLRKALGDDRVQPRYIVTVPKKGYRLVAPVEAVPALPEQPRTSDRPARPETNQKTLTSAARPGLRAVVAVFLVVVLSAAVWLFWPDRADSENGTAVVGGLHPVLGLEWSPSACDGTDNVEACQRYRMAIEHFRGRGEGYKRKAIELLEEATALDPRFAAAHAYLAAAYIMPGDEVPWPRALAQSEIAMQRALELGGDLPETRVAQAVVLLSHWPCPPVCVDLDDYRVAEHALREAIASRPELPIARMLLGSALYGQGRLDEAFGQFDIAYRLDPLLPSANYYVILGLALRGDYEAARSAVSEFIEHVAVVPPYMYTLAANIERFYGNFDASLHYHHLRSQQPSYAAPAGLLADTYFDLGMFDHAEHLLLTHRDEAWFESSFVRAWRRLLIEQDRLDELAVFTRELSDRAEQEFGDPAEWPRWLLQAVGQNLSTLGDHDRAMAYLITAFGEDGRRIDHHRLLEDLDALHVLAHSLIMTEQRDQAQVLVEYSLTLLQVRNDQGYGGLPDVMAAQARAYALLDRKALAIATLRQATAHGWRGYWSIRGADDPCWRELLEDADFQALLAGVREEVDQMRARAQIQLTHTSPENL